MMEALNLLAKVIGYAFLFVALAIAVFMCISAMDEYLGYLWWRRR